MRKLFLAALMALSFNASASFYCHDGSEYLWSWTIGEHWVAKGKITPDYCWANGAELDWVRGHFSGLHQRLGNSVNGDTYVIWTNQEDLIFLVDNL